MEYDRSPATKALRRAQRKQKMKEYRKATRKERKARAIALKEKALIKLEQEYYKTEEGQKEYYIKNLKALISYYEGILDMFGIKLDKISSSLEIFAQSYNVLRIMSGMPIGRYNDAPAYSQPVYSETDRLIKKLSKARKKVCETVTGKHKVAVNKQIRVNMLYNIMNLPYELIEIIVNYE